MTTTRIVTAAAVGCLYTAAVAWLVSAEGRSYRAGLRRAHDQAAGARAEPRRHPEPEPEPEPEPAAEPFAPPIAAAEPTPPAGPAAGAEPSPAAPAEPPAAGEPAGLAANVAATPKPVPAPAPAQAPAARSPGAVWADTLELGDLSPSDEARLGSELRALVLARNPVDPDGDVRRLLRAAAPLLEGVGRKEVRYSFAVLASDEVNAFSLPGGFVFVSRGLLRLAGEDVKTPVQDYVLQFVLAHEIAHVDKKHALALVAAGNARAKAEGIDTLSQFMAPLALAYTDAQEFEADDWAYQRMTAVLGRTVREALMFLIQFRGYSDAEPHRFPNGRMPPDPSSGRTLAENHFRAHPAAWARLDRLMARAERPPGAAGPRR